MDVKEKIQQIKSLLQKLEEDLDDNIYISKELYQEFQDDRITLETTLNIIKDKIK